MKHDRSSVLSFVIRLENEPLLHGVLRIFERDLRQVHEHPISLQARDGLAQEQVAFAFLSLLDVYWFGDGLAVDPREPKLVDVVVDVQGLFFAFPHTCLSCFVVA